MALRRSGLLGDRRPVRSGFTLIELLVVVAIIVLLIAILLPSLGRAKSRARTVVCLTHLRGIGQGFGAYSAEFANYLPMPIFAQSARDTGTQAANTPWQIPLWQYATHIDLTTAQINSYTASTTTTSTFLLNTVFVCPQGVLNPQSLNSANCGYCMNSDLPNAPLASATASTFNWNRFKRITPLINPSATMYAADADQYAVGVNAVGNKVMDTFGAGGLRGDEGAAFDDVAQPNAQNRHNFCVNVLMGDGSAASKQWVNNPEIPSYVNGKLNGVPMPTAASLMAPDVQLFWYGTYSPGDEFSTGAGGL